VKSSRGAARIAKVAAALLVVTAVVVAVRMLPVALWLEQFKAWVEGRGALGYVFYILVYVVCCVFLIPASALTLGAGAIFGVVKGSLVNLAGATLGAAVTFILARTSLRHRVERMAAGSPKFTALDRAIAAEGNKIMWLARLSGFPPFTWVNYVFGLTGVRFGPYVVITLFGIIPGTVAITWAGAAGAAAITGAGNRVLLIATAVGALLVSVFVGRIATRAIRRAGVTSNAESNMLSSSTHKEAPHE
jgi:uncharacterized membrane protein YdjX (TVP38/TMEM64 family)